MTIYKIYKSEFKFNSYVNKIINYILILYLNYNLNSLKDEIIILENEIKKEIEENYKKKERYKFIALLTTTTSLFLYKINPSYLVINIFSYYYFFENKNFNDNNIELMKKIKLELKKDVNIIKNKKLKSKEYLEELPYE
jgi:hypothetical protein